MGGEEPAVGAGTGLVALDLEELIKERGTAVGLVEASTTVGSVELREPETDEGVPEDGREDGADTDGDGDGDAGGEVEEVGP